MARVAPFRALRYHSRFATEMARIAAPPYDVIGEKDRHRYLAAHPQNVVRLILPGEAGQAEDGSFYSGAAALLDRWRRDGILVQDPRPAFYPYRQTFVGPDGVRASRLGFLGALRLEQASDSGGAHPHEMTLQAPRQDRARLIAACRANLSPVFLLHPDSQDRIGPLLDIAVKSDPLFEFTDEAGVVHELWKAEEPQIVDPIQEEMAGDWTLIADGHHRYESAMAVMKELPEVEGAHHVLACFCRMGDRGFRVFPIHRMLRPAAAGDRAGLRRILQERFPWESLPDSSPQAVLSRLREAGEGTFAVLLPGGPPILVRIQNKRGGRTEGRGLEDLDTLLLQREILTGVLGITPEAVTEGAVAYTPDAAEAQRQVASGEAAAAFLLNPLRMEAVIQAARAGMRLPQKSTYFYPKVFSGLVIRPF